jgi:hypothetical protein
MFADDVLMADPKTTPETLAERLDRMDKRIEAAVLIALSALGLVLIVASKGGG